MSPDTSVPLYTGHMQQWFGGSFNRNNFVNHDTINFTGTAADGSTFSIHLVDHLSTTPNVARRTASTSASASNARLTRAREVQRHRTVFGMKGSKTVRWQLAR